MDGYTYSNMFETKGIEYLIIIAFLLLIIPFWIFLNNKEIIVRKIQQSWDTLTADILRIPQGLFFSKNHTWAQLGASGIARVGLDDLLLRLLGQVKISHFKSPGEKIKKGELLVEINQDGKTLSIYSPLSGEIMKSNMTVKENPEILNEDPYEKGWIYNMKPTNWIEETKSYYLADKANNWLRAELDRFKDFVAVSIVKYSPQPSMVIFQEGGELRNNPLSELQPEIWEDFQKEFLNIH